MTACENLNTRVVTVSYIATHTNHPLELKECKYLPLPKTVAVRVKTLLASGVQMEKIANGWYTHACLYKYIKIIYVASYVALNASSCT